jgi:hypothetical protein
MKRKSLEKKRKKEGNRGDEILNLGSKNEVKPMLSLHSRMISWNLRGR